MKRTRHTTLLGMGLLVAGLLATAASEVRADNFGHGRSGGFGLQIGIGGAPGYGGFYNPVTPSCFRPPVPPPCFPPPCYRPFPTPFPQPYPNPYPFPGGGWGGRGPGFGNFGYGPRHFR